MTTYNRTALKTYFETGDVPDGNDYANLIDSCANIAETSAQVFNGPLNPTELITPRVSATNVNVTSVLSAATLAVNTIAASSMSTSGSLSVGTTVSANAINVTTDVSATAGTVYASAMRAPSGIFGNSTVPIVSAAGTAQGTATVLTTSPVVRGQGTADGTTTGFALPANRSGMMQFFIHEGAVSGNLWPPTGGTINALAANAAFALAANTMYTIIHKTASAYAVK